MPRVWLAMWPDGEMYVSLTKPLEENVDSVEVEMNNSLYRQIQAADTKYYKFQAAMLNWLVEAQEGRLKRISDGR